MFLKLEFVSSSPVLCCSWPCSIPHTEKNWRFGWTINKNVYTHTRPDCLSLHRILTKFVSFYFVAQFSKCDHIHSPFQFFQKANSQHIFFGLVSKLLVWVLSNSVFTDHVSWIIKVAKRVTYWECKMWVIFKNDQLAQFSLTLVHLIWYKYKKEKTSVRLFCLQGNLG